MEGEIAFDLVPANVRIPGAFIEFSNRLAGNTSPQFKLLVIGQRLAAGTVAAGVPTLMNSNDSQTEEYFGRGAMLSEMVKAIKAAQPWLETWAIALDDDVAGVAATGTLTITGSATASGTLYLYIAGKQIKVGINSGDTQDTIATAVADAISANTALPVTAVVNGVTTNQVDLACRWKGETGNDIDVRLNYYGESTPAGVAVAIVAMAGGSGNPDISTAIAAMAGEWYNWVVTPYTDATNLIAIEDELETRYGPMVQMGGRAFTAYKGTLAATGTFGNTRNSPHVSCMGTGASPTPPHIWAAVNAVIGGFNLMNDPARPLQTLKLPGVLAPAIEDRFSDTDRNTLLWDGIATYTVASDGSVHIERQVTMYQLNTAGLADDSYLDINTPETLERIRLEQRFLAVQKYPRHKLAEDDIEVAPGQPIMQPKKWTIEMLALYRVFMERGWCQDYEGYKATLVSQINGSNPSRLDFYDSPKLVGQMRIVAGHTEFRR